MGTAVRTDYCSIIQAFIRGPETAPLAPLGIRSVSAVRILGPVEPRGRPDVGSSEPVLERLYYVARGGSGVGVYQFT
ncbi:hypothetical protein [Halovalidus salilacus]|uniref:hypothetical protein n=1 Tax=Halovalidus salilacus TaxID=3075124 RepID=UPI00387DC1C0